ncbi:MAG: hypothetical protein IH609_01715 [Dehalococcoidia bacterium]|nr:hypothetical protein [Dehalococcoidia bacterium]
MRGRLLQPRQPLLFQPVESQTGFNFQTVVDEARAVWFPEIADEIEVRIMAAGPVAFISRHSMGRDSHVIAFHPVLNRPGTPLELVRFIAKHELTHIIRPPRWDGDWYLEHPPEFWQREFQVAPERFACWAWAHRHLSSCLRDGRDGLSVLRTWRRRMAGIEPGPYMPHLPFDDVPWGVLCPEGGAQLRLPPVWAWRPQAMASC